jgi:hypothetical protein
MNFVLATLALILVNHPKFKAASYVRTTTTTKAIAVSASM